jgi:hypothetical protein
MSIGLQQDPAARSGEPVQAMDTDRKEWLKDAMANLLKNPIDDMKVAVKQVQTGETAADRLQGLESLASFVEQIDLARDLHKLGGLSVVISRLDDESSQVRAQAAHVIGTTVHNNPEPQQWASELGALEGLTKLLGRKDASPQELTKALFGISSLIRQNDPATIKYVKDLKGVALVLDVLKDKEFTQEEMLPCRRKAVFQLLYLVTRAPAIVPATAAHCVPIVCRALKSNVEDFDFRENALLVLKAYSTNAKVLGDKRELRDCTEQALIMARKDEDETGVIACEELLAMWKD